MIRHWLGIALSRGVRLLHRKAFLKFVIRPPRGRKPQDLGEMPDASQRQAAKPPLGSDSKGRAPKESLEEA